MKSINDSNNNGSNNNNWLGFSLSTSDHTHPQAPTSFYLSPNDAFRYGYGENGNFHSPLSGMPLKSDGSLCIMEALTRSHPQGMVTNGSPKLEDFLGGPTMEAHEYGVSHDRESMSLSLDSLYFNPNSDQETTFRQHQQEIEVQNNTYYSSLSCNGMYQTTLSEEAKNAQHIGDPTMGGVGSWMSTQYSGTVEAGGGSGGGGGGGCGELQSLSLSMSPGSQSSCVTVPRQISPSGGVNECVTVVTKKRERVSGGKVALKQPVHRKSIDTFGQRTSQYRGVTRHRWTGRYEAHLWDNSCKKEGQTRKGRQVYLGGYDMEDKAARAYDQAALKYWGPSTHINFPLESYREQLEDMKNMTRQEYVAHLRRKSSGFSRGASMYRGVTRHHQHGRWQARIGRVAGNKDLYLGTFSTQEEAAEAYDIAAIKFRGANAVTNFDISRYDVEKIMASNTLLAGDLARRNKKEIEPPKALAIEYRPHETPVHNNEPVSIQHVSNNDNNMADWKMALYQQQPPQEHEQNGCLDGNGYHRNNSFAVTLQDLIGIDSVLPSQAIMEDESCCKLQGAHYSNPSSLVTSLSSSREASPDKNGHASMLFPKPPVAVTSSWISSAELRGTAVPMAHFPVFAAWNDS